MWWTRCCCRAVCTQWHRAVKGGGWLLLHCATLRCALCCLLGESRGGVGVGGWFFWCCLLTNWGLVADDVAMVGGWVGGWGAGLQFGETALMRAAGALIGADEEGHTEAVSVLVGAGAALDVMNRVLLPCRVHARAHRAVSGGGWLLLHCTGLRCALCCLPGGSWGGVGVGGWCCVLPADKLGAGWWWWCCC